MSEFAFPESDQSEEMQWQAFQQNSILFDGNDLSAIEVRGNDRHKFLHNFCSNEINKLEAGHGCEAFFCNVKGRILALTLIANRGDSLLIMAQQSRAEFLLAHLDKYLITEDVELEDRTSQTTLIRVCGPKSLELIPDSNGLERDGDTIQTEIESVACELIRWDCWTQLGAVLVCPSDSANAVVDELRKRGADFGSPQIAEAARINAMFPLWGTDISDDNLAQEANRSERAISFTKGCYLGQEPIARLDAMGHVNRELARVVIESDGVFGAGAEVRDDVGEKPVGALTSVARIPGTSETVGIGMLKASHSKDGTSLIVQSNSGESLPAIVESA